MTNKTDSRVTETTWLTSRQRVYLCLVLAAIAALRVLMMFQIPLTDTTEARYAEIARKMVETDDWITPQFQYGIPFWGKPPLHTWVSALGMEVFGVNQFGARSFIFLISLLTLWMLYRWLSEIRGRDDALVGVVMMASCALIFLSLANVMTDMVMAAGTYMSMAGFYSAMERHRNAKLWGYLFFVGIAIGMLAKGPVAVVLTGLPIGLWVLLTGRWKRLWQALPWISGTVMSCAIFVPWYIAAELKTPGFLEYFIVGEHIERFLRSGWKGDLYGSGHAEVKGMIWIFWFAAVLPWGFFFLAPLFRAKRIYRRVLGERSAWSLYLTCWALSPMLFFTMASNILATYVITGVPAACFLVIELWRHALDLKGKPAAWLVRFYGATVSVALILMIGAYASFQLGVPSAPKKSQKYLVEKVKTLQTDESAPLYYWKKRYYSAEFYMAGQVVVLDDKGRLEDLLNNHTRDFLALPKNRVDELSPELLGHFTFEGSFGKDVLYFEVPEASLAVTSNP
jgi:4-amino-4-deoxy-L-arabinose transferase-like glycosyltransferase